MEVRENGGSGRGGEEEEDGNEEVLSLCDLPIIHLSRQVNKEYITPFRAIKADDQEDFGFCIPPKESEMCTADQVFYQGQILPLRRLISSSRSESMDNCFSGGFNSSKSSSISSHHSTSWRGSSTTIVPGNRSHSHPSPSPKLHYRRNVINNRNCTKKLSAWDVFRLGLVAAPPEITLRDLKGRLPSNTNCKNRSGSSGVKKIKHWDFLGVSCKCSVDAVGTVPLEAVIKRNASEEESLVAKKSQKKRWSHHGASEWLKQLSFLRQSG